MIRVGTIKFDKNGARGYPSYPGFKNIEVMTASSEYGELGPYVLGNDNGQIMENIWQAAKVYKAVPKTKCTFSRWDKTVVWDHPNEIHVDSNGNLTPEYWAWREKLTNNEYPVRYPVGFRHRHNCLYAYWNGEKLDYIESRKKIYFPVYTELVKKEPKFEYLKKLLEKGENLLIMEVDGPKIEALQHYKDEYGVDDNFIQNDTILVTEDNMKIMLNDPKFPAGHGYVLSMALLDMNIID